MTRHHSSSEPSGAEQASETFRAEDAGWVRAALESTSREAREEAYRALMTKYWRLVILFARSRLGREEDAEDLAQEVFLRAFRSLRTLRDAAMLPGWLLRIAANLVADQHRARGRRPLHEPLPRDLPEGSGRSRAHPSPAEELEAAEELETMLFALDALPGKYRDIIVLRYFHEIDGKSLSRALGEPEGTLRNRLFRAIEKLRRSLAPKAPSQPP